MTISKEDQRSLEDVARDPDTGPAVFNETMRRLEKLRTMNAGK